MNERQFLAQFQKHLNLLKSVFKKKDIINSIVGGECPFLCGHCKNRKSNFRAEDDSDSKTN